MIIVVWPLSTKVKPLNCNSFFFFTHLCESDSFNLLIFCFLVNYLSLILCTTFCTWWLLRFYNQGQIRRLCLGRAGRYVEHFDLHAWLLTSWISSCWLLNGSYCHYMFFQLWMRNICSLFLDVNVDSSFMDLEEFDVLNYWKNNLVNYSAFKVMKFMNLRFRGKPRASLAKPNK